MQKNNFTFSWFQPWHGLVVLIFINLFVALFIGNDFGQSWDEPSYYLYGERSFEAYKLGLSGKELNPQRHIYFIDLRYYGPFYTALGWKVVNSLQSWFSTWSYADVWHFINFSFFQISLISLFVLAKRYMSSWIALGTVVLFNTQPLLFGHAFINPKDIPFMTFFLTGITLGLLMADKIKKENTVPTLDYFTKFHLFVSILFGLFVFTYVGKDLFFFVIEWIISALYNAPSKSVLGELFLFLTGNNSIYLPVENYIQKATEAHIERILLVILLFILIARKIYISYKETKTLNPRFKIDYRFLILFFIASITLGLTISIRILAPFAGVLIAIYMLWSKEKTSIPILIYYFSFASIVSYLTWPFLWDSPLYNFLESLQVMRKFPFVAQIRFMGDNISSANLPWTYIPVLVSVQMTESVLILTGIGMIFVFGSSQKKVDVYNKFVLLFWFALPIALHILLKSNAYDNFRQFLFILPPLFIFAGIGWELLLSKINNQALKLGTSVLLIIPGILGIFSLHPYQYIYYNSLTGGLRGAEGNFETDYWLTSYRETVNYINEVAPQNAQVLAWGAGYNVRDNVRKDIIVFDFDTDELTETYNYAVITTRFDKHLILFPNAPVVFEVRQNDVLLAVVKKLR